MNDEIQEKLNELVLTVAQLPKEGYGMTIRAFIGFQLKYNKLLIFENDKDPKPQMVKVIDSLLNIAKQSQGLFIGPVINASFFNDTSSKEKIESLTHNLYGDCWINFNPKQYDEATDLLRERLEKNNFDFSLIKDKVVLDAGCGGGRYSFALSRLGAKKVVGVDMGTKGIAFANKKVQELGMDGKIEFIEGNMLSLPFTDETFDFVYSNGVIHHTVNTEKGLSEVSRVLKKKGTLFVFVQGTGGYQWSITDACREILKSVPKEVTQQMMILNGIPHNRIFYMMDHLYVPIQDWQTKEGFESMLQRNGLPNFKRLLRGVKFDGIEKISLEEPFAKDKYGTSELRYLAKRS